MDSNESLSISEKSEKRSLLFNGPISKRSRVHSRDLTQLIIFPHLFDKRVTRHVKDGLFYFLRPKPLKEIGDLFRPFFQFESTGQHIGKDPVARCPN